jgi:hypothetical protein
MDIQIDLKELSIRESERVEWKENGDDIQVVKSIVKTIAAFAKEPLPSNAQQWLYIFVL